MVFLVYKIRRPDVPRAHDVAAEITRLIDKEVWLAGQRLPTERALCAQFGSARLTLRRALDIVAQNNRIVRHKGRGCYVRSRSDGVARLGAVDFLRDLSEASPGDIMELRLILEPAAAAIAVVRATSEDLAAIERACSLIPGAATLEEREQADAAFHFALFKAARNPLLVSLCASINAARNAAEWTRSKSQILTPERQKLYDLQHSAILDALLRRDVEAASAVTREHLDTLRKDLWGGRYL
jgi:DNA-binding FadR family transcriptional regulator